MTTTADVKRVVTPICNRHADVALVSRMLVLKPVRHILRFICIDRCSDPFGFRVCTALSPTFAKYSDWSLSGGRPIFSYQRSWDIRDNESMELLRRVIEDEALPELRQIRCIDDYFAYRSTHPENAHFFLRNRNMLALISIAKGDLNAAASIIESGIETGRERRLPSYYPALRRRDRSALLGFLRNQQLATISTLKLEEYFKPTPFPIEIA